MDSMAGTRTSTALLRSLRAVRRFSADPIPEHVLRDILEAGRWTGSSKNTQPWQLVVIRDRRTLETLAACGPFAGHLAGAQAAIALAIVHGRRQFDEGRLAQNLMLAAWAHGVGSCIGSLYPEGNTQRAMATLEVPAGKWLHTAISLGYPADTSALRLSANPGTLSTFRLADAGWRDWSAGNGSATGSEDLSDACRSTPPSSSGPGR
jgi:nitroreductase